jgi:glucose/arabinose dehydrogenase
MSGKMWQLASARLVTLSVCLVFLAGLLLWTGMSPQPAGASGGVENGRPRILLVGPIGGLDWPVHITHAGDGSGRIFVVEQPGRVRIIRNGTLQAAPFLDISDRISCCGERGLLSIAFPPGYASSGRFYVNYTNKSGNTIVARYRVTANPDVADPDSEEVVLAVAQPYTNHNGGQLAFGPNDGYLYIGMGDGGSAGDPQNRAQNPASLLGKMLRIDVESGDPLTYTVPATNPFSGTAGYRGEIWALGLRNPWRFSFDAGSGDLYIGDVGQDRYEEIDYQPASSSGGENYGWRIMEGNHCFNPVDCEPSGLIQPIAEYPHPPGECASVTGGMVYRGSAYPGLTGIYFYGDYCSGRIWALVTDGPGWQSHLVHDAAFSVSSFGSDEAGNLWLAKYAPASQGAVYRVAEAQAALYLPLLTAP